METNGYDTGREPQVPAAPPTTFSSCWNAPDRGSKSSIVGFQANSNLQATRDDAIGNGRAGYDDSTVSANAATPPHFHCCTHPADVRINDPALTHVDGVTYVGDVWINDSDPPHVDDAVHLENDSNADAIAVTNAPVGNGASTVPASSHKGKKGSSGKCINNPMSITACVLNYYMTRIASALNAKLNAHELDSIVLAHVENDEIAVTDCQLTDCTAWWENQTDFTVDVVVYVHHMKLTLQGHTGRMPETVGFVVTLWFSHANYYVAEISRIVSLENYEKPSCKWKLDDYLLPVFSYESIDEAAEEMWQNLMPGSLDDPDMRRAFRLADKLDLKLVKLRVADSVEDHILFFSDGFVMVQDPPEKDSDKLPPPRRQNIEEGTIVLNTSVRNNDEYAYPIYAACLEYYYYFNFFVFNQCVDTRIENFSKRIIQSGEDMAVRDPLSVLRPLVKRGAMALMLPYSDFFSRIDEAFRFAKTLETPGYKNHEGWRYDYAIRAVGEALWVRTYRARQRLVQKGRIKAKGAVNYDPDCHVYFTPFSFSAPDEGPVRDRTSKMTKPQFPTYSIKRGDLFNLYRKDRGFRELFASGEYAFINGLTCACDPNYIRFDSGVFRMTSSANADVTKCCLRYFTEYNADKTQYVFDHNEFRKYSRVIERGRKIDRQKFANHKMEVLSSLPQSFPDALRYLMQHRTEGPINESTLANLTGLPEYIVHRYCYDPQMMYFLDEIIVICIALNLAPWKSKALMDRAGMSLLYKKEDIHLAFILDCLYLEPVKTIQNFLKGRKYRELLLERGIYEEKYAKDNANANA